MRSKWVLVGLLVVWLATIVAIVSVVWQTWAVVHMTDVLDQLEAAQAKIAGLENLAEASEIRAKAADRLTTATTEKCKTELFVCQTNIALAEQRAAQAEQKLLRAEDLVQQHYKRTQELEAKVAQLQKLLRKDKEDETKPTAAQKMAWEKMAKDARLFQAWGVAFEITRGQVTNFLAEVAKSQAKNPPPKP